MTPTEPRETSVTHCRYCKATLTSDEDEQHNHGICSACWYEAAAEAASQA